MPRLNAHFAVNRAVGSMIIDRPSVRFDSQAQEDELLQKVVEQTIQRPYGEGDLNNRKLIRIAAVYSAGRKQISRWKVVE